MDSKKFKEYKQYLSKIIISDNKRDKKFVFDTCLQYYKDLADYYKDYKFTKKDFEKLVDDNGNEVEQDIVLDLFSKNNELPAEEVFLYLFKNNVLHINSNFKKNTSKNKKDEDPKYLWVNELLDEAKKISISFVGGIPCGTYRSTTSEIFINGFELVEYSNCPLYLIKSTCDNYINYSDFYTEIGQTSSNISITKLLTKSLQNTIYHELSHIFELKTYMINNKKYLHNIKLDLNSKRNDDMSDEEVQERLIIEKDSYLKLSKSFFELQNEMFARKVLKDNNSLSYNGLYMSGFPYYSKHHLLGACTYNNYYAPTLILQKICDKIDLTKTRFNDEAFKNEIQNYFPAEEINKLKLAGYLEDTTSLIETVCESCVKPEIPNILVDLMKRKISLLIKDPKTPKNKETFEYIDDLMKTLDENLPFRITYSKVVPKNKESALKQPCYILQKEIMPYERMRDNIVKENTTFTPPNYKDKQNSLLKDEIKMLDSLIEIKAMVEEAALENNCMDCMTILNQEKKKERDYELMCKEYEVTEKEVVKKEKTKSEENSERSNNIVKEISEHIKSETKHNDIQKEDPTIKSSKDSNGADRI